MLDARLDICQGIRNTQFNFKRIVLRVYKNGKRFLSVTRRAHIIIFSECRNHRIIHDERLSSLSRPPLDIIH